MKASQVAGVVAAVIILLVLWFTRQLLAAAVLGVTMGVVLNGPTRLLHEKWGWPRRLAAVAVAVCLLAFLGLLTAWIGESMIDRLRELSIDLGAGVEKLREWLSDYPLGREALDQLTSWDTWLTSVGGGIGRGVAFTVVALGLALLSLVVTLFIAIDPWTYYNALHALFPPEREKETRNTLAHIASALRWWFIGRAASMVLVAILTGFGLWLVGIPMPWALGVIAGVLSFVPNLGPTLSAVPGVLLAITLDQPIVMAGWALGVYIGAQMIESHLITPLIQQYVVSIPAAFLIISQILMGVVAGIWGIIVAPPLLIVLTILVQKYYIRDVLGRDVQLLGADARTEPDEDEPTKPSPQAETAAATGD
jgi:predicted PurR-regulated permease PerM